MKFRLFYEGPLYSDNGNPGAEKLKTKIDLFCAFDRQLRKLWETNDYLKTGETSGPGLDGYVETNLPKFQPENKNVKGRNFCPLARKNLHLNCKFSFLVMRQDKTSGFFQKGDIDNKVKFLIDCLRVPSPEQFQNGDWNKLPDPCFVVLEDDSMITQINVESDQLLDSGTANESSERSVVIIDVELRPYQLNFGNIGFG
jgi:hypothetical protein